MRPISRHARAARAGAVVIALAAGAAGCTGDFPTPPKEQAAAVSPGLTALTAPASGPADGATQLRIVATVDSGVAREQRSVVFRTTAGSFGGAKELTVAADSARTAVALLTAPTDSGVALVTATAGGATRRVEIQFTVARPERLELASDQFSVGGGFGSIQLTATVRRRVGTPTAGTLVQFFARDSTGRARGRFTTAPPSDATGRVVTRYSPAGETYLGPLVIVAETEGVAGRLRDSTVVQIVAPR